MTDNGLLPFPKTEARDSVQFRAEGVNDTKYPPTALGIDWYGFAAQIGSIVDELPAWWSPARDIFLRRSYHNNTMLAAMVYGESVRVKNMPYQIMDESKSSEDLLARYQLMFSTCNFGQGLPSLLHSVALDMLTQDNGAFIELIGDNRNTESPLKGEVNHIAYMDAGQCWRTYDPEYPVVYVNPYNGKFSIFHYSRVIAFSPFRQGMELARGLGMCALSRAYEAYRMVRDTNTYVYEKVTGQSPELYLSNVPVQSLEQSMTEGRLRLENLGFRIFKGSVFLAPKSVVANMPEAKMQKVGIKEAPDGFDHREEVEMAVYAMCAAFGVDAREYVPGTRVGETKADAELQDVKAEAKGLADIINSIENALNWRVLPKEITFKFEQRNQLTEKREAEARLVRVQARATQIQSGELLPQEARQLAAETGDIDPAFLQTQAVAGDNESMAGQQEQTETAAPDMSAIEDDNQPDEALSAEKAIRDYRGEVRRLIRGYWNGLIDRYTFTDGMVAAVYNNFNAAWLAGAREVGVNPRDITPGQWRVLANEVNAQYNYVSGFADAIMTNNRNEGGKLMPLFERGDLWLNQYDRVKAKAMIELAGSQRLKWKMGLTREHCKDCVMLEGRVYTAKVWKQANIAPQSHDLACHGFNCGCTMEVTHDPITPGKPPTLSGGTRKRGGALGRLFGFLGR